MGTQGNEQGGENRQAQQPGRPDDKREQRKPEQGQDQGQDQGDQGRFMQSDDDVGGDVDADGEINQPGQTGNQDRERSGSTRSRNP